jgi:hypothetical protein
MESRPRISLDGINLRVVWTNMVSKTWWGKWLIGFTILMTSVSPFIVVERFGAERAAVALVTRSDSGGPVLIPARCGLPGTVVGTHYIVAEGKPVQGRAARRACFYTVSAFRLFFPDRYKNDDPATFRVQQLTTGMRLLVPSTGSAGRFLLASVVGPFLLIGLGMAKSFLDLAVAKRRQAQASTTEAEG